MKIHGPLAVDTWESVVEARGSQVLASQCGVFTQYGASDGCRKDNRLVSAGVVSLITGFAHIL